MPTTRVHGACPHDCPDTCGVITEVEDGRAVRFYADPDHPVTNGWLCAKVRPYLDHVYHPDRLQYPLRRIGSKGSGRWERISWDAAIQEIVSRWNAVTHQYGPEAILPYSYSGTLGLVQMIVSSARFWNRLGASRLERSICGEAAAQAVIATLGAKHSPPYHHLEESRLVIIWGHNPVSTAPHVMPFLRKAQRKGCRVIVIDPRKTRSARVADQHIAPRPGSDGALALGMAHVMVKEGLHDEAWLNRHALGWPELRARLDDYPPVIVAEITGLDKQTIVDLARRYGSTKPAAIKFSDGLQRRVNGGQTSRAVCALPAVAGQYGVRGGGLFYSTGGYIPWDADTLERWPECPRPPGRIVNMCRLGAALTGEVTDPPIMSLYVFGANPAAISPHAGLITRGLQREDLFTVVHELFMTDTASYADLVLPATSQLEHADLHKAYGHTRLTYNHAAIAPLGESRSNWEVLTQLSCALGFNEPWLHQRPDEIIDELIRATARHTTVLDGITLARLKEGGSVPLAIKDEVPFSDGRFLTPSGKVELRSATMIEHGLDPLPLWQEDIDRTPPPDDVNEHARLRLVTPAAHHFVTSSFANHADLRRLEGAEPFIELHPDDAEQRHIATGDLVEVRNRRGACRLRAVVTTDVRPGVAASPKGYWGQPNVNWTTPDALADLAGQSTFHSNDVWVSKVV